jgi:hypothetical protein
MRRQYRETNLTHFLFSSLRINGFYIRVFRVLLIHSQEALHNRHLVYWCKLRFNPGAANWYNYKRILFETRRTVHKDGLRSFAIIASVPKVSIDGLQYYSFIHLAVCLTTGPKPLPKRAFHIVRSRASSFRCDYALISLRSSGSFLRLLSRLLSLLPSFYLFFSTCCRRQFLRKMWQIQLAFRLLISCRVFFCY